VRVTALFSDLLESADLKLCGIVVELWCLPRDTDRIVLPTVGPFISSKICPGLNIK
jgi:hypothetical protein